MLEEESEVLTGPFARLLMALPRSGDVFQVAQALCRSLRSEADADGCELKLVAPDGFFNRIYFDLSQRVRSLPTDLAALNFSRSGLKDSLYGSVVEGGTSYAWTVAPNSTFPAFVTSTLSLINRPIAILYDSLFARRPLQNFLVIPFSFPEGPPRENVLHTRGCLVLFNLSNSSTSPDKVEHWRRGLDRILPLLLLPLANAVHYSRANDEVSINADILNLTARANTPDCLLQAAAVELAAQNGSPITTLWLHDQASGLLGLHYLHVARQLSNSREFDPIAVTSRLMNEPPHQLRVDESLIGTLVRNPTQPWIKLHDVLRTPAGAPFVWREVYEALRLEKFIAVPLRKGPTVIGVFVLHPDVPDDEFERLSLDRAKSFLDQLVLSLNYLEEKTFTSSIVDLASQLQPLLRGDTPDITSELVLIIKDIVRAEACSMLEVRTRPASERGIYLVASSDTSEYAAAKVGTKLYNIDNTSITGYVALTRKPITVYDVTKVAAYQPGIQGMSNSFLESTGSGNHRSYIGVPIWSDVGRAARPPEQTDEGRFFILRCINKQPLAEGTFVPRFTEYDAHVLRHVGLVALSVEKAIRAVRDRDDLLEVIIHEVKAPLVSLRNKLDDVYDGKTGMLRVSSEYQVKISDLDLLSTLVLRWVGRISTLSDLLQDRKVQPQPRPLRLWGDLLENAIYWLRPQLVNAGLEPAGITRIEVEERVMVNVDFEHLLQVFYNLLGNSIKYRKPGHVPSLSVQFKHDRAGLVVRIADRGVGVHEDVKERLFMKHARSDYALDNGIDGKGLGLWLCWKLLEWNGCSITLAQAANPTAFEVTFPWRIVMHS